MNDKITAIKKEHARVEKLYQDEPEQRDPWGQAHEWIGYLLQLVEEQTKRAETATKANTLLVMGNSDLISKNHLLHAQVETQSKALEKSEKFISGIMSFYGQGLSVHNWHQNGDGEPWDNFFDENMDGDELEKIREALSII